MNNLSNPDVSRQPPHRAHRGPAMSSDTCKAKIQHRKRRIERLAYEEATYHADDLELIEIRYQALRARMALEEVFAEGSLSSDR
jgi:hypothetical protein